MKEMKIAFTEENITRLEQILGWLLFMYDDLRYDYGVGYDDREHRLSAILSSAWCQEADLHLSSLSKIYDSVKRLCSNIDLMADEECTKWAKEQILKRLRIPLMRQPIPLNVEVTCYRFILSMKCTHPEWKDFYLRVDYDFPFDNEECERRQTASNVSFYFLPNNEYSNVKQLESVFPNTIYDPKSSELILLDYSEKLFCLWFSVEDIDSNRSRLVDFVEGLARILIDIYDQTTKLDLGNDEEN